MNKNEVYRCDSCGNQVEVQKVGGGALMCCGHSMTCTTSSLTEANLAKAFVGECVAHTKYELFGKLAEKEGYRDIARHFRTASGNEKVHAKLFFRALMAAKGEEAINTEFALKSAIDGESYEDVVMYPDFAEAARHDNLPEIEALFMGIGTIEHRHADMFRDLLYRVESNLEYHSKHAVEWICEECGHVHYGHNALDSCPVCKHPAAFQARYLATSHNVVVL
ncbi:ferritin family protein [Vibrio sp. E150_011]